MNGSESLKQAAINKAKQVANMSAHNGQNQNNGKTKRRKQDLKPIITTEQQAAAQQQQAGGNPHR